MNKKRNMENKRNMERRRGEKRRVSPKEKKKKKRKKCLTSGGKGGILSKLSRETALTAGRAEKNLKKVLDKPEKL